MENEAVRERYMKTTSIKVTSMLPRIVAAVAIGVLMAGVAPRAAARGGPPKAVTKDSGSKQGNTPATTTTTAQSSVSFSGEAGVVNLSETGVGLVTIGQTGALLSGGGELNVSVGATNLLGNILHTQALSLGSAQATTVGTNNQTASESIINNFSVTIVATDGTVHTISFDSLHVQATATATASGVVKAGNTMISGLVIDNMAVAVTGQPNQTIAISGGTITINAQSTSGSGNQGEISVAGLLIALEGCATGPIGFARAGISFTGKPPSQPPTRVVFVGGATVIEVTNACTGRELTIGGTGAISQRGGIIEVNVGPTNAAGTSGSLSLEFGEGLTIATANQTHSEVTADNFTATLVSTSGVSHTISFDFLKTTADARATSNGVVTLGSTVITGLKIDNMPVTVTGQVNQMVALSGGGTVVINAQASMVSGNQGGISVAGLIIAVDECLTVIIGKSQAAISFTGVPPTNPPGERGCDKLTGGGFIYTTEGAKGTFGVSGGIRRGQFWGHLNYIDHGTGMHVHSTGVTGYAVIDATTRKIDYNVDVDGSAGTCTVIASDKGEPGRNDIFDITLSNGYHVGGDLGGSGSGGGNIQLHKCPPGWAK